MHHAVHALHHRLWFRVLCEFFQLVQVFSGQESFRVAYRVLLDGPQTCSLIFREIEFLLPCEEACWTLRAVRDACAGRENERLRLTPSPGKCRRAGCFAHAVALAARTAQHLAHGKPTQL
jgi:hypothetical protein